MLFAFSDTFQGKIITLQDLWREALKGFCELVSNFIEAIKNIDFDFFNNKNCNNNQRIYIKYRTVSQWALTWHPSKTKSYWWYTDNTIMLKGKWLLVIFFITKKFYRGVLSTLKWYYNFYDFGRVFRLPSKPVQKTQNIKILYHRERI